MIRVLVALFVLFLVLPAFGIYVFLHGLSGNGCTSSIVNRMISPDGAWQASVEESFCQSPFLTDIADEVHLVSLRGTSRAADILNVDTGGDVTERPRIGWAAPDILRVTVPNLSFLEVSRREFGNIHVDIGFDPDDPSARAAWLRELDAMTHGK